MPPVLDQLAQSVTQAQNLEGLTRPLLDLIQAVTGMESSYLTAIDERRGVQHVLFSHNRQQMQIPEGLSVTWGDTLCKRALEENRPYTDDVASCWGDSDAARQLGIQTYLSQPVRMTDGTLYGTLCAASGHKASIDDRTVKILGLFARIIAFEVERERHVQSLERANKDLTSQAHIDPLTRISNRRGLINALNRMLAQSARRNESLQIAFVDLDGFKAINDLYGHDIGDRLLVNIASRLSVGLRTSDYIARYGGDEFVVVVHGSSVDALRLRISQLTVGLYNCDGIMIDYKGASVGVVDSCPGELDATALLSRADQAMYKEKRSRSLVKPSNRAQIH